ncbi:hypothetical protein LUQ84_000531 [Hamiltosporidium tvaerminnensis]|nr:hypothetical protein LUQ84_000531 [Hamiltosporidium tvaerminnensis]
MEYKEPLKITKRLKDKSDRATTDKVLDPKTLAIITKLLSRNAISDLQGSISTGKEANIYVALVSPGLKSKFINSSDETNHGITDDSSKNIKNFKKNSEGKPFHRVDQNHLISLNQENLNKSDKTDELSKNISFTETKEGKEYVENTNSSINEAISVSKPTKEKIFAAIKIYKTSIMPFKDREKYIQGEQRYKTSTSTNPRKMVKLWAEKEVRNLKRIRKSGILCPKPLYLKRNILIMTLIGEGSDAASKLKDISVSHDEFQSIYLQCLEIIKNLYRKAKLIHADLSEYNLLYYQKKVYTIDVGQSVDIYHENGISFLIMDIKNINAFFSKKGCEVKEINDFFEEVTGFILPECLSDIEINHKCFVPTCLNDVFNTEDCKNFTSQSFDTKIANIKSQEKNLEFSTENTQAESITMEKDKINKIKTTYLDINIDSENITIEEECKNETKLSRKEKWMLIKQKRKQVKEEKRIRRIEKTKKTSKKCKPKHKNNKIKILKD